MKANRDYGPGAFIDGTKYIPLVERDTFFLREQHKGSVQIPSSPTSIWDETRNSEYSQLYKDFLYKPDCEWSTDAYRKTIGVSYGLRTHRMVESSIQSLLKYAIRF